MRGFKLFSGLALLAACSIIGGTAEVQVARADVEREVAPQTDNLSTLVAGNTEFAFDLYHQLASEGDGNLIFSPHSISLAFAMVYAGARGDTAAQMAEILHYTLSQEQLHPAFNALDLALQPPQREQPAPTPSSELLNLVPADNFTLTIANAVWGQEGFPFEEEYLDTLALNYGVGLNLTDFTTNPENARQVINHWVEEATGGRIRNLPPPGTISPATRLALVNAIYFKGEWTWPFTERSSYDGVFHLPDGSEVTVPMMVDDFAYMKCGRGDSYYAIQLTYGESSSAAMLIMLPDAGQLRNFENTLDSGLFQEVLAELETTNMVTFTMPRFGFESEVDLRETLSALGMTLPFGDGADFTGISSDRGLFIDYAAHKATISVDEQGTEATGATGVMMALSGVLSECGSDVMADRPFVFAIYDSDTSAILFLGRVMNPAV